MREIAMQLKKLEEMQVHVKETPKDKVSSIGDHAILKEFEDVF
jgi:hypothetical protein